MPKFVVKDTGQTYRMGLANALLGTTRKGQPSKERVLVRDRPAARRTSSKNSTRPDSFRLAGSKSGSKSKEELKQEDKKEETEEKREDPLPAPVPEPEPAKEEKKEEAAASKEKGEWTDEEDAKLMEMKDDGKHWPKIAEELGRPKKEVTKRYGELMKARKAAGGGKDDKKEHKTADGSEKPKDQEPGPSAAATLPAELLTATDPIDDVQMTNFANAIEEVEGTELTAPEMINVCRMHDYFEHQKWVAIASELFNRTGKRISPESLRDVLMGNKWTK